MGVQRTFRISMSERRHRFSPDALMHAPRRPGVYQFLTPDRRAGIEVLYVGLAIAGDRGTVYGALAAHLMGHLRPTQEDMRKVAKEIYFEYLAEADVSSAEDYKDIAGALIREHTPRLNPSAPPPSSGKYESVALKRAG